MTDIHLINVPGIPLIETGDNLSEIIIFAIKVSGNTLEPLDVVVVTSKIVSKSEGCWVNLNDITPNDESIRVAEQCNKDPREVHLILSESLNISRIKKDVLITEHRLGFISANAGIDHSNTREGDDWRLVLPRDPDESAKTLRHSLSTAFNVPISVIISDSHGRPFRLGTLGVAIGVSGLPALWDLRGTPDLFDHTLQHTEVGFADEIATATGLLQGQGNEGRPVTIVRGLTYPVVEDSHARDLLRPKEFDLYR